MANASPVFRSPTNPHFFKYLLPDFQDHLEIPGKFFSEHIKGKHEGKVVNLITDASERTWKVNMEGDRFTEGWNDFVESHDLRIRDFLVFRHEGDVLFHVTAFGSGCCEVQYTQSHSHEEDEERDETEISSRSEKEVEDNLNTESDQSSSEHNCSVTASNLSKDSLGVLIDFARRNGLSREGRQEIVLMNEEGKSWSSELQSQSCRVSIIRGWTRFCTANKLEVGDSCTFRLLRNTETLVFQLCSRTKAEKKKKVMFAEDHVDDKTRENRFVKLTPKPSSLESGKQHLPASFTRGNKLINPGKIILVDKNRAEWSMNLKAHKSSGTMYIINGNDWKSFCAANEVGAGESLILELIQGGASPLLKFCPKMEQPPFVAEARAYKRARVKSCSQETRRREKREKTAEEGEPSRPSSKFSASQGNLQQTQACYVPDQVAKMEQSPFEAEAWPSAGFSGGPQLIDEEDEVPPINPNLANPDLLSDGFPAGCRSSFAANRKLMRSFDRKNLDLVVPVTPPFSERFITEAASRRYSILSSRGFIDMQVLPLDCSPTLRAQKIITKANLLSSVTSIGTYVEQVVREFYANLVDSEYLGGGRHDVYIRGKMFEFSPELINQVFNLPEVPYAVNNPTVSVLVEDLMGEAVKFVSGGSIQRWKDLSYKHLIPAMTVLYKICCYNWLPTTKKTNLKKFRVVLLHMISKITPFNMGKLIFDQIILNAKQCCTKKATLWLKYPNLIYLILQYQRQVPQLPGDVLSSKPKLVTLEPNKSEMSRGKSK